MGDRNAEEMETELDAVGQLYWMRWYKQIEGGQWALLGLKEPRGCGPFTTMVAMTTEEAEKKGVLLCSLQSPILQRKQ